MEQRLTRRPEAIRAMFAGVASRYDLLNRLLSLRQDVRWRRRLVAVLAAAPAGAVLDLASGTGDVALAINGRPVIGADFCTEMLSLAVRKARRRVRRLPLVAADALALPFRDASFAAVTVAFGVRNFADLDAGLSEMRRVLAAGGVAAVLEFQRPRTRAMAGLVGVWNRAVVTPLGRALSPDGEAYAYLPASIDSFPAAEELGRRMAAAGLEPFQMTDVSGGIAALTAARRVEG